MGISPNTYLTPESREKRWRDDEPKRMAFISQMAPFLDNHGTDKANADELLHYAVQKLDSGFNMHGVEWASDQDSVKFHFSWAAHSFFDDGGGEEGCEEWTFTFVGDNAEDYCIQNEKLMDTSCYEVAAYKPKVNDLFYVKDPFGLSGVFEVKFYGSAGITD